MAKKYAKDYRLIDSVDERGRLRTETEYMGGYYRYVCGAAAAGNALRFLWRIGLTAAVLFLLPLLPPSSAMRTMFVTLPYLFTAIPLWLLLATLWELRRAGDRLDHRQADRVNDRLPGCCLWLMLLPGVSFLGELATLLFAKQPFLAGDGVFLACDAAVFACALLCSRRRRGLSAAEEKSL